jgi:hypothetical protein
VQELRSLEAAHQAAGAVVANRLRESPSRELQRFTTLVEQLTERARRMAAPSPVETYNPVSEERRTTNLDEIQRWLGVGPALAKARVEIRDSLWRLDDADLPARIEVLRGELVEALRGTPLEHEL